MGVASHPDVPVPWFARWAPALPLVLFAGLCSLLPAVARGEAFRWSIEWLPERGIELGLLVDGLSLLFALLITGIGVFVLLYSCECMRGYRQLGRFTAFLVAFMLSMLGLVLSDNLILLFVFWELTTLTSFLLIGYSHESAVARRAALQGLLVTGAGALAMLAGFVLLGDAAGTYSVSEILRNPGAITDSPFYLPILFLVLAGAFTKSAQFPFHFWLPNAMAAPTPVSAYLHSATMVKAGVFLLARMSPVLGGTEAWSSSLVVVGAITAVYAAFTSLLKTDLKQMLAYTTVMALGVCVLYLGLPVGPDQPPLGVIAAMSFILVHALYKAALFMVAGTLDHQAGSRDLRDLGGLGKAMPLVFTGATLAGLSMAGVPPFLGFVGKELLYTGALESSASALAVPAIFAANAAIVAAALLAVHSPFAGRPLRSSQSPGKGSWLDWTGPLVLGAASLVAGLFAGPVSTLLLVPASESVTGESVYYTAGLWHGLGLPLGLSALTLVSGGLLYRYRAAVLVPLQARKDLLPLSGDRAYDATMAFIARFSVQLTRVVQCGVQRRYLLIVFTAIGAGLGATIWAKGILVLPSGMPDLSLLEWGLVVLIAASAIETIRAQSRLLAICSLGVVGVATALIFLIYGAPDVAMAQFTVETLVVVIVAIVLRKLPTFRPELRPSRKAFLRDFGVACLVGASTAALLLAVTVTEPSAHVARYFEENSVPLGHGRNVVNVILVDFRALDTLGEITVLVIASIAAFTLATRRPRYRASGRRKGSGGGLS